MRTTIRSLTSATIALLLVVAPVASVAAAPPERTLGPGMGEFFDPATGTFVLANISGEAWCDWALGGFGGDPPVHVLTEAISVTTGAGASVFRFHETWELEAFRYPREPESLEDECAMIESLGPWATGSATITLTDNDQDTAGPGESSFGWSLQGSLVDGDGRAYRFARLFRALIVADEFIVLRNAISIR